MCACAVFDFEQLNKIDEGTYGVVYKARERKTGEIVALKQVKLINVKEGFPVTALREINVLLSLSHPNIINVREMVVGNSMDKIFMVMDFMEHDLKGLMNAMTQPFTASEARGGFRRRPALGAAPTPRRGLAFALRYSDCCSTSPPRSRTATSTTCRLMAARSPGRAALWNDLDDAALLPRLFVAYPITSLCVARRGHSGEGAWGPLLEMLCRVGHAGEMFTSAAPQDPTFWPLHGLAERFVQYARVLKRDGAIAFAFAAFAHDESVLGVADAFAPDVVFAFA